MLLCYDYEFIIKNVQCTCYMCHGIVIELKASLSFVSTKTKKKWKWVSNCFETNKISILSFVSLVYLHVLVHDVRTEYEQFFFGFCCCRCFYLNWIVFVMLFFLHSVHPWILNNKIYCLRGNEHLFFPISKRKINTIIRKI